jgi:hypothetical protein
MSIFNSSLENMEFQDAQRFVIRSVHEITARFQKVPGSAMLIRYIQSSYQDDPVRSAIELVLVIFFVRYLLSPSYSTKDGNFVKLTEEVSYFFLRLGWVEEREGWADGCGCRKSMIWLMSGLQNRSLRRRQRLKRPRTRRHLWLLGLLLLSLSDSLLTECIADLRARKSSSQTAGL